MKLGIDLISYAVIRVYDDAGNVIETHEHRRVQRMVSRFVGRGAALGIVGHLRRRFDRFKLGAHFL